MTIIAILTEIFVALSSLWAAGTVLPVWQTNPVLKHPAGRWGIGILVVAVIIGWNVYQHMEEEKKRDDDIWAFTQKEDTQKAYCTYLGDFPEGRYAHQAQLKCSPVTEVAVPVAPAEETKPIPAAAPAEEIIPTPATEVETDEQKAEKMVLKANDYVRGENGKKKSIKIACRWYKKAADLGNEDGKEAVQQPACQQYL